MQTERPAYVGPHFFAHPNTAAGFVSTLSRLPLPLIDPPGIVFIVFHRPRLSVIAHISSPNSILVLHWPQSREQSQAYIVSFVYTPRWYGVRLVSAPSALVEDLISSHIPTPPLDLPGITSISFSGFRLSVFARPGSTQKTPSHHFIRLNSSRYQVFHDDSGENDIHCIVQAVPTEYDAQEMAGKLANFRRRQKILAELGKARPNRTLRRRVSVRVAQVSWPYQYLCSSVSHSSDPHWTIKLYGPNNTCRASAHYYLDQRGRPVTWGRRTNRQLETHRINPLDQNHLNLKGWKLYEVPR
ncbi:hypothetical protein CYLTODRAFT_410596 [Cylindrobasidium torrendii FP15055 ss-10]|uniref:Uncharacterized protein n=1 Tax=Cylindrobasidium torrendii FP15055 ss-10 TaxID=1314674 RepID=A0A0D7BES2_9AGAR|nr:hypothetical protein CYLTODRAFT_410596 [Cylindrobasidium torrendii FP15055 ss-10]